MDASTLLQISICANGHNYKHVLYVDYVICRNIVTPVWHRDFPHWRRLHWHHAWNVECHLLEYILVDLGCFTCSNGLPHVRHGIIIFLFVHIYLLVYRVLMVWLIVYWCRSGEFGFRGKMWEAVRSNLYFFAAALLVSVIFIVYMLAAHGSSSAVEFVGLMMAMGNTYGVLLIICLLGKFQLIP